MLTRDDPSPEPRLLVRAIAARYLRIALVLFGTGLVGLVAVATLQPSVLHLTPRAAEQIERIFFVLCVLGFMWALFSWFTFRTAREERSFVTQRLPSRYRLVAWSIVSALLTLALLLLWYTTSLGLTQW